MMAAMAVRSLSSALLAWVLPGLGHAVQRRYAKAAYFGLLILGMYGLGLWLGQGASVSADRYAYHVYGQYGAGLPAFLASLLGQAPTGETIDRLELGVVFTTVAGIMNIVVMVDAYEWRRGPGEEEGEAA